MHALVNLNTADKFTAIVSSHISSDISAIEPSVITAALFTKISIEPNWLFTRATKSAGTSGEARFPWKAIAVPPLSVISETTFAAASALLS